MRGGLWLEVWQEKISALRGFFLFLLRMEWIKENPLDLLEAPRYLKKLPSYLTVEEIEA